MIPMLVTPEILPLCIWSVCVCMRVCVGVYNISLLRYSVLQSRRLFWTLKLSSQLRYALGLHGVLITFPAPN